MRYGHLAQAQTLVPMEVDAPQAGIFPHSSDGLTSWPSARLARLGDVWRSRDGPPQ
jgi:hypothetical protein